MNIQIASKKQKGFTIIELVVVILLLGILAATALPRFLDVTDEAHEAVVDGLQGGIQTGVALFRAAWVAKGQPTAAAVDGFGANNLFAGSGHGYPIGILASVDDTATPPAINSEDACRDVYNNVLQGGRPTAMTATRTAPALATAAQIETQALANTGVDVLAEVVGAATSAATGCRFVYVGQYRNRATGRTIPALTFTFSTGEVVRSDLTFEP